MHPTPAATINTFIFNTFLPLEPPRVHHMVCTVAVVQG